MRGRNRSSSAKFSNTTSLLPATAVAVRSNSFRVHRNTGRTAGNVTPNFCQHIKYCCLHQNLTNTTAKTCLASENVDRTKLEFSDNRVAKSVASQLKVDDSGSGFSNFSDDEKSMKLTRKFSVDASINLNPPNIHNKQSLQHSYENFDTRKCNCGKSFSLISFLPLSVADFFISPARKLIFLSLLILPFLIHTTLLILIIYVVASRFICSTLQRCRIC